MHRFFDAETTGIPRRRRAPVTDLANWPRGVQLARALYGGPGEPVAAASLGFATFTGGGGELQTHFHFTRQLP
ncbi:MAG: hypothetical protein ACYDA8_16880 [Deferrisomatales bacterium]